MKSARHEKIIELIQEYDIDTQEELAARLNEAGFKVTQATVSRDIRALKLMKVAGKDGKSCYAILTEPSAELGDKYTRILQDTLTSLDVGQNMLVIRTVPGMAMGVAPVCLGILAISSATFWDSQTGSAPMRFTMAARLFSSESSSAFSK